MNSDWIKTILDVEETRSLAKSAENLYCSQSTVARNISKAEEELDVEIFCRHTKRGRIELSAEGNKLIPSLRNALAANEKLLSDAAMLKQKSLTIGWNDNFFSPEAKFVVLEKLYNKRSKIVLQFTNTSSNKCMDELLKGQIDGAIIVRPVFYDSPLPEMDTEEIKYELLGIRPLFISVGENFVPDKESLRMQDLKDFVFIVFFIPKENDVNSNHPPYFDISCRASGFVPKYRKVENASDIKPILATRGEGVYLSSAPDALRRIPGIRYIRIEDAPYGVAFYYISLKNNHTSKQDQFVSLMREFFEEG